MCPMHVFGSTLMEPTTVEAKKSLAMISLCKFHLWHHTKYFSCGVWAKIGLARG